MAPQRAETDPRQHAARFHNAPGPHRRPDTTTLAFRGRQADSWRPSQPQRRPDTTALAFREPVNNFDGRAMATALPTDTFPNLNPMATALRPRMNLLDPKTIGPALSKQKPPQRRHTVASGFIDRLNRQIARMHAQNIKRRRPTPEEVNAMMEGPAFDPLFDEIHKGNPLYKTGRVCPCACNKPFDLDEEGVPPRDITADVTEKFENCGHEWPYQTRCDVWYAPTELLHQVEFPHVDPAEWESRPIPQYAPHAVPLEYVVPVEGYCSRCQAKEVWRPAREPVDKLKKQLWEAWRRNYTSEETRSLRWEYEDAKFDLTLAEAIAQSIVKGEELREEEASKADYEAMLERQKAAEKQWGRKIE